MQLRGTVFRVAIEVVPYDAQWPEQFDSVARELRNALGAVPSARVEHVGSTSVPGLAAKPILDIDTYIAKKTAVLQQVLAASDVTETERREIARLNDPSR